MPGCAIAISLQFQRTLKATCVVANSRLFHQLSKCSRNLQAHEDCDGNGILDLNLPACFAPLRDDFPLC